MSVGDERPPFDALRDFLDGYLNEDYVAIYGSAEGAAAGFSADASRHERREVAAELGTLLEKLEGYPLEVLQERLCRIGGSWRPRSFDVVREVLDVLRAAAD
jgi:hypothetical protein